MDLKFIGTPDCSCHYPTMTALLYTPIVLSLVALGAHFLRYGNELGVIVSILLIGLLFLRRAWVARLVQLALVLGTIEWLWTMVTLVQIRAVQSAPATRMVLILGAVALVAFGSALLFQTKHLKRAYRLGE
jgi:hypothetical protein